MRYGKGSVLKINFQGSIVKMDPCPYIFKYLPDVLKMQTRVFDIFNMDKKCFELINVELSPQEIWVRICFLQINGSPSLIY